ncbi:hypothetical protein L195_g008688 [Trifolium pratense]|uniref:Uncharacterized protein n=1 Tax=Trifolium pratense TaxID=57577 RepID=A0A2K3P9X3_TRIPR|nr:hypothetical protein L195_g008688 [Trifolium pratense]
MVSHKEHANAPAKKWGWDERSQDDAEASFSQAQQDALPQF